MVTDGRVTVNGKLVTRPGSPVDPRKDEVAVDGTPVRSQKKRYIAVYKPMGYVCTKSDELGRRILSDLLPAEWSSVYPVGRLDRESEGLILMTNDGEFCLRVSHPRYGVLKKYRVTVRGKVENRDLKPALDGLEIDGEFLRFASAKVLAKDFAGSLLEVELLEGRNREIRRVMNALGYKVENLRRTQIGNLKIGNLKPGKWRVLLDSEINHFLKSRKD